MSLAIITGSNGLVGSETAIFLLEKGFDVIGIDNNERKKLFGKDGDTTWLKKYLKRKYKKYKHYDCDIRDNKRITQIFRYYKKKVEFVLHAAAQPSHDWAYKNIRKDFEINALGTLNILESVKNYSPEAVFIFTSTNKVYGDNPNKIKLIEKKNIKKLNSLDVNINKAKKLLKWKPLVNIATGLQMCIEKKWI